jgi:corrinoid protein of di/trimethylamine methyltransferase
MQLEILQKLADSIIECDPDRAERLTQQALEDGVEPMVIIEQGLTKGMKVVGNNFQCGQAFLPDLIIAAEGMQRSMTLLEPELRARQQSIASAGVVVLGTVKGDIHEIGKTLVGTMLSASGFTVHDLGTDVPTAAFIEKIRQTNADILGLSSLLTTTMVVQREVIDALSEAGLRDRVKVMVGGAPVTRAWADKIGADGYADDATGAVVVANQFMGVGE